MALQFAVLRFDRGPDLAQRRLVAAVQLARAGLAPVATVERATDVVVTYQPARVAEEIASCLP